jgi:serine/threonine-protein kinase
VQSSGFAPTAPRVVTVEKGEPAIVHFDLAADERAPEPERAPTSEQPRPTLAAAPAIEQAASPSTTLRWNAPAPSMPLPRAMRAPGLARLNLNSIPISNVVIDGHPLGQTPKVGVPVEPGVRQVVFVHPELGRLARSVQLSAGENQTVAVRF